MRSSESPSSIGESGVGIRSSLAGSLLIAVPKLMDPNFHRMVVLMVNHDEEGAFGLVLGPASQVSIADLCASLGTRWERPDLVPLRYGGPCEPSRIWVVYGGREPLAGTTTVAPGVHVGSSVSLLEQLSNDPERPVLILSGYAGWGPGQLEREMLHESWLPGEVTTELVFSTPPSQVWEAALALMNLTPERIVSGQGASA
ncbi:MAG: YqgE/AlgH family protein [Myxococcales bacterium]|nr:YqgE/AlgH family protein [Myxococcota bacterium]MDW8280253.1 YqgE/AlgH family protein [Myxococcales bacterium]